MIHVGALPGTPASREPLSQIVKQAGREARIYQSSGVHGLMIENMHDTHYLHKTKYKHGQKNIRDNEQSWNVKDIKDERKGHKYCANWSFCNCDYTYLS